VLNIFSASTQLTGYISSFIFYLFKQTRKKISYSLDKNSLQRQKRIISDLVYWKLCNFYACSSLPVLASFIRPVGSSDVTHDEEYIWGC